MGPNKQGEIEKVLQDRIISTKVLRGGSGDTIYLLETSSGKKFVYKSGTKGSISSQSKFYRKYHYLSYLPELIYSSETELIYKYLKPRQAKRDYNKVSLVEALINNLISKYERYDLDRYGFESGHIIGNTFSEFLRNQLTEAYSYVQDIFTEEDLKDLLSLVSSTYSDREFSKKYLIHGDLNFQNILYTTNKPLGIIDPDPIVGHPLYDFLYLFCSTPKQFEHESYERCLDTFMKYYPDVDVDRKEAYLKIALFKRISSCRKHHPDDLNDYLEIWKKYEKEERGL